MSKQEYIEKHIKNTCDLIIQHLKNIIVFQKNVNEPLGHHSRFIERLFHPEDQFIFKGYSKAVFQNKSVGSTRRKEHIVPMSYLMDMLWLLIEKNELSDQELSNILRKNLGIAYISYDEQQKLDTKPSGLKTKMPEQWCLRTGDPLERLKAVGIELVDENGNKIASLI